MCRVMWTIQCFPSPTCGFLERFSWVQSPRSVVDHLPRRHHLRRPPLFLQQVAVHGRSLTRFRSVGRALNTVGPTPTIARCVKVIGFILTHRHRLRHQLLRQHRLPPLRQHRRQLQLQPQLDALGVLSTRVWKSVPLSQERPMPSVWMNAFVAAMMHLVSWSKQTCGQN